ncbi:MAG: hypothetical protein AAGU17_06455 [Anaerolineaceae bacterium]
MNVTCEYCGRDQPAEHLRCIGCGAPLPIPRSEPLRVSVVDTPPGTIPTPATPELGAIGGLLFALLGFFVMYRV